MSTIGRQYKPQRSFTNGVDNTTPIESPEIANTLSLCLNGEMVDSDIIKTRPGYMAVTNIKNNYIIRQGIEYAKSDGTKENIVYLEGTTITGTSGILGRINGSTINNITTGLPDGLKPVLIQAGSLLFIFTGITDLVYDGTSTRQIGIDSPVVPPSLKQSIVGNLNDGGFYVYVYTYRNSVTGATSSPSLPSPTITNGTGNKGIRIQVTPGDSTTADSIDVYRTTSSGIIYFYDGTTTINSTIYDSTIADVALGDQLELDNSRLPEPATIATLLDNRLFVAGFKSNPSRIQYSKIGINGSMYESFQIADICDCNINDGEKIIGLGKIGTKVGVVKETKAGKLIQTDISSGTLETGGSQKYLYREMNSDCTSTSQHTLFTIDDSMGWLGSDNVYLTDGFQIKPIANRIRTTIRGLNFSQSYKFSVYEYHYPQQMIISVCRNGVSECDYQLVCHFANSPVLAWTMFSPGVYPAAPSTHPGIQAGCMWSATINNLEEPYIGSNNGNGKVFQYGKGTNDDTKPIFFQVKNQWECGQDAMDRKSFHSIKYLATTGAVSPNNILNQTWEEDGKEYSVKNEVATITPSTKWNTAKWNTFKWSGLSYTLCQFYPNRKAFLGRFGFYNDELDAPMAIKSMRLLFRPLSE